MSQNNRFSLTQKLYLLLTITSTIIYTVGIWMITPETDGFLKSLILGAGLSIQVCAGIYFALKKTSEEPDERFYANLGKSAFVIFIICIISMLLLAGIIACFGAITLTAGALLIAAGVSILLFGVLYFLFEKRG